MWGVLCACSWTWCIGMYLPVILINRFGWPGFIAFAVPNIVGCAGLAFVLHAIGRKRGQAPFPVREVSEQIVTRHAGMMAAFSLVTVAFQVFFATWLVEELIPNLSLQWWMPMLVGVVVYLLGLVFAFLSDRDWLAIAIVTYGISIAAAIIIGPDAAGALDRVPASGAVENQRLWWVIPTLAFGFLLCPYLDLTFHRAAQTAAKPRAAFAIFGVTFAIMLALTVLLWFGVDVWTNHLAAMFAVGHIFAQLIFTVGVHLREARLSPAFGNTHARAWTMPLPAIAAFALPIARLLIDPNNAGEWTYLFFLACYGLLFPAYVLVAMATGRPLRSRGGWMVFTIAVLACVPLYAQGFLFNRTWWLLLPVALFMVWGHVRRAKSVSTGATAVRRD